MSMQEFLAQYGLELVRTVDNYEVYESKVLGGLAVETLTVHKSVTAAALSEALNMKVLDSFLETVSTDKATTVLSGEVAADVPANAGLLDTIGKLEETVAELKQEAANETGSDQLNAVPGVVPGS